VGFLAPKPMSDATLSSQSDKAWKEAEQACFNYICNSVGYEIGVNAFLGDSIGQDKANLFAFCISGGPEQPQNFQSSRPSKRWLADALLVAQFKERDDALNFVGRLMDSFPAYQDPERRTGRTGQDKVVLDPNVCLFEFTTHPILGTRTTDTDVQYHYLVCQFRVQYNNNKLEIE
jgi:hypothetical protein